MKKVNYNGAEYVTFATDNPNYEYRKIFYIIFYSNENKISLRTYHGHQWKLISYKDESFFNNCSSKFDSEDRKYFIRDVKELKYKENVNWLDVEFFFRIKKTINSRF